VRVGGAHLQIDGHRGGFVKQVMAIASALWKRRAIACVQHTVSPPSSMSVTSPSADRRTRSSWLCQWRWLDQLPGGRHEIDAEIATARPRSPQALPLRAVQGASMAADSPNPYVRYGGGVDFGHALLLRSVPAIARRFQRALGNGHHLLTNPPRWPVYLEVGSRNPHDLTTCSTST